MEAFFFKSNGQQLYACYHPAKAKKRKHIALLFCYPLARDYFRVHRVYRQIASRLSKQGFDCLRFDYFGTGDSAGDSDDVSWENCLQNVKDATAVLATKSSAKRLYCTGHWLGATLAQNAAATADAVNGAILFDPVLNGRVYLQAVRAEEAASDGADTQDFRGFVYDHGLLADIEAIDHKTFRFSNRQRITLISSNADCYPRDEGELDAFVTGLRNQGLVCQHEQLTLDLSQVEAEYDLLHSLPAAEIYEPLAKTLS